MHYKYYEVFQVFNAISRICTSNFSSGKCLLSLFSTFERRRTTSTLSVHWFIITVSCTLRGKYLGWIWQHQGVPAHWTPMLILITFKSLILCDSLSLSLNDLKLPEIKLICFHLCGPQKRFQTNKKSDQWLSKNESHSTANAPRKSTQWETYRTTPLQ